jgi:MFS transporter, SET family, sugar efflux transporter
MHDLLQRCRPFVTRRDFRTIAVLSILLGFAYSFVTPFFSLFGMVEVGMSPMIFSVFMTLSALSSILAGTVLAHYSDTRFSRRSMLLLGGLSGAAAYAAFAFVRNWVALTLISTLILSVSSISFSQVFACAREALALSDIPPKENAFYMNAFRMFFALSWTVGPAVASWIMVAYSYTGMFLCASACFLLFTAVGLLFLPTAFQRAKQTPGDKESTSLFRLLGRSDILAHFSAFVLVFMAASLCMMNLPMLIVEDLKGRSHDVGVIFSLAPVFELPFMLLFGILATKRDPGAIIKLGFVLAALYYGALFFVRAPWQIYPLQAISAAATAITAGVSITYFQSFLPKHPGTATNLFSNAMRFGSTIGNLLFGGLVWSFGHRAVFVACTFFCLGSLALMRVPRVMRQES